MKPNDGRETNRGKVMNPQLGKSKLLTGVNALLAALLALAGVIVLWRTKGEDMTIMFSLMLFVSSAAFLLAYFAAARHWRSQCYLQLLGPAFVVFALFGTVAAALAASIGMLACWLKSRKSSPSSNSAA